MQRGEVPLVALVHGSDGQLLDDVLAAVERVLFRDPGEAVLGRELLEGTEVSTETIVRSALTLPLMAALRLVVVRRSQALAAKGAAVLTAYVRDPNPATRVLLLADEPLAASRERRTEHWLLQAMPAGAVVELPAPRGRALEDWLRQRAAAEGLTLSDEAARLLVQWVGDDTGALLGETRKAALAGGPTNRRIGVTEVGAVVGEHRVSGVFDLTRAVERRDVGLALRTLDRLLATEEPMLVLSLLTREVRTIWMVQAWRRRGDSVEQIARLLRRPPSVVDAIATAATARPPTDLAHRLRRCFEVESRLKSGGAPRAEMAALVAELCAGA